jgi:hypothetical protein
MQEPGAPASGVIAPLACQFNHIRNQAFFVSTTMWQSMLCGPVLAENAANPPLRNLELAAT